MLATFTAAPQIVGQQLMAASVPVALASDQTPIKTTGASGDLSLDATLQSVLIEVAAKTEFVAVTALVTNAGDTTLYTPAAGKKIRLRWSYALNDPAALTPARITIKLGSQVEYITYGVSKSLVDTGPINGALIVNLSAAGNVACTFRLEEI